MKMNLSIVMGMVDKVSAPLKGIASESDHYAKKIKKVQKAQADDASAMAMIDSYKALKQAKERNNTTIKAEIERLKQLKQKAQELAAPSAQLTERIAKQTAKLKNLTINQNHNKNSLSQLRKHFDKTGIKIGLIDDEYQRLNKRYRSHGKEITKLTKRYARLKSALAPIQKLNSKIKFPKIGGAVAGKGAALLGGLSIAGIVSEVNNAAAEMDALAKKSATLKMSIGELQAMRKQASHAGVDEDTMSSALTRFTKRLGVLQQTGSGILGSYLKKSGNSALGDLKGAKDTQQAYDCNSCS